MPISWESNLTYLKLGKNLIPLTKDDNEPAKVYISFRGTTVASKPKYPDRAIRAKEKDGGDFYNSSTTFEWKDGENDTKYAEIEVFKQDDKRKLLVYGTISLKDGTSTLNPEGFKNNLVILPKNVSDVEDYVAETLEEATGEIFSQDRTQKQARLRFLNNGKPFPAGVTVENQKTSVAELGNVAHFSVVARFKVDKLPKNPKLELILPFTNGMSPLVVPSFIDQNWWLTEPENENSKPKDISNKGKELSQNLLLPPNSNKIRIPLDLDRKWMSTDNALVWYYPLDQVKTDSNGVRYIEELIGGRNGTFMEEPLAEGEKLTVASVEKDGKTAIDFNKQFYFMVNDPVFATSEDSEFSVSLWYYKPKPTTSYGQFCDGRYTNNQHYLTLQLIGTQGRHHVRFGGYGNTYEAHYFYQKAEIDSGGHGWFLYTWTRNTKTGINNYYVNDVLVETQTNRLYPIGQAGRRLRNLRVGKYHTTPFMGHVLDFKGFNKELTHDEVKSLYNLGTNTTYKIGGSVNVTLNGIAVK